MKLLSILILPIFAIYGCQTYQPRDGDIIFQTSLSNQSKAVQLATRSPYSHMGIVYIKDKRSFVYEAARNVKLTPLQEWVKRGKKGTYVVKRLIKADSILSGVNLKRLQNAGKQFAGKPYDLYFEWSDERMYCSELVWKMYKYGLDLEIGELKRLHQFDLSNSEVIKIMKKRYGEKIPLNEMVISPESMFDSKLLRTVFENEGMHLNRSYKEM